jgi:hypothetical protein
MTNYTLSVATTVVSTLIIVFRIVQVSRFPGTQRTLHKAMEIIIESAALYSISALVYIPMIARTDPNFLVYLEYADVFFANMAVRAHTRPYSFRLTDREHRTLPLLSLCYELLWDMLALIENGQGVAGFPT